MQSLAIVICTLLAFGVLLFGSDLLDRRLTLRSIAARPASPTDERAVAAVTRDVIEATADDATEAPAAPAPPALAPIPPAPPVAA